MVLERRQESQNKEAYFLENQISTRTAVWEDLPSVLEIYNEGIKERIATFETRLRNLTDIEIWLSSGYPFVVACEGPDVKAFAITFPYSSRDCYSGIAEFSVYVRKGSRGNGLGRIAMEKLIAECESKGLWKLVSRIFVENFQSRKLMKSLGFREVGIYEKHAKLDGKWRDTVIVEYLITKNII